ncbi:MAG: hydrogenase 3 maturation endopeptidase HyCI [candidate division WOR-3 bacterium]|nr:hydrogenase 3 maturation endopeptidase HyCI [candidate division WOR-3 bacterium]
MIIGIGNRMRSDDAIGSLIAEELKTYNLNNVTIFDVGITPENYIDKAVAEKPDWIIFVDACNFDAKPGEYKLFEENEIQDIAYGLMSTHTLPLTLTIELIKKQHNCRISLLGIQPKSFTMSSDLSTEILNAKSKVIEFIKSIIKNFSLQNKENTNN